MTKTKFHQSSSSHFTDLAIRLINPPVLKRYDVKVYRRRGGKDLRILDGGEVFVTLWPLCDRRKTVR